MHASTSTIEHRNVCLQKDPRDAPPHGVVLYTEARQPELSMEILTDRQTDRQTDGRMDTRPTLYVVPLWERSV